MTLNVFAVVDSVFQILEIGATTLALLWFDTVFVVLTAVVALVVSNHFDAGRTGFESVLYNGVRNSTYFSVVPAHYSKVLMRGSYAVKQVFSRAKRKAADSQLSSVAFAHYKVCVQSSLQFGVKAFE